MARHDYYQEFPPYVSVAERRRKATKLLERLRKKGRAVAPVTLPGTTIARTFWGKSWCTNLESYHDYASRLPRGRSYLRNGSVIDLQIAPLCIEALVSGSEVYEVSIKVKAVEQPQWRSICRDCAGGIDSLVESFRAASRRP